MMVTMRCSIVLAVLALSTVTGTNAATVKPRSLGSRVDEIFAQWNRPDSAGCSMGVLRNGKVAYERGYGMANLEQGVPNTPDTVFYIASVSKQFTAAAVALLAEEGKLSLDDDIRTFVPEIPFYGERITIRQLIHHTSGLRDYLDLWVKSGRSHVDSIPESEAIALLARQDGLEFSPGSRFKYSNSGYLLLSVIVKRVSGKSLSAYADNRIFKPLGMAHTHFHDDRTRIVRRRASSYFQRSAAEGGGLGLYQTSYDLVGDGGLLTTVHDFYRWDQNFRRNVLGHRGQTLIDELTSTDPLNDGAPNQYAFGLMLGEHDGMKTINHSGGFLSYRANYVYVPQLSLSVVALCNQGDIDAKALTLKVVDLFAGGS